jgi:hypothetical protein
MNRKTLITTATAAIATVIAGGTAMAANLGILNGADDSVGELSPVADAVGISDVQTANTTSTSQPEVVEYETVYVDQFESGNDDGPRSAPSAVDSGESSLPSATPTSFDDNGDGNDDAQIDDHDESEDEHEDELQSEDEHEEEVEHEFEYEGAEDDD